MQKNTSDVQNRFRVIVLSVIASCSFFVWIIFSLPQYTSKISLHIDEIAWFIDTDVFEQVFIKKDITSEFWQSYQRYDQPQIVKYIYGAYLWSRDTNVFTARKLLEQEWGRWGIYTNPETTERGFRVFESYILQMRQINFVALIGTLFGFYMFLMQVGGVHMLVAMIGTALLAYNPMFLQEMTHATHDGFMLFFLLTSLLFYSIYFKNRKVLWMISACVFAAFSVGSKLTGIIAPLCIWIHEIIVLDHAQVWKKYALFPLLYIPSIVFVLWVVLNPTLYKNPVVNTVEYFSLRTTQTRRLQEFYPSVALTKLSTKVRASWCTLVVTKCIGFFEKGTFTSFYGINILLVLLGSWHIWKLSYDSVQKKYIYLLIVFLLLTIVWNVLLLPMHYGRYYLPIQIGIFVISACGLEYIWRIAFRRR